MNRDEIVQKIEQLREQYKTAVGVDKKLIATRGKLLKFALEKKMEKQNSLYG